MGTEVSWPTPAVRWHFRVLYVRWWKWPDTYRSGVLGMGRTWVIGPLRLIGQRYPK